MEKTFTKKWSRGLYLTLTATALVILAAMLFVLRESKETMATIGPLADAAMEVTIEANLAHLYIEEYVTNRTDESLDKAWHHLDVADDYARGIMAGDTIGDIVYSSIEDNTFHEAFGSLQTKLSEFREVAKERIDRLSEPNGGAHVHHQHDSAFVSIVNQASLVEEHLRLIIASKTAHISHVQTGLIFGSILFFALVGMTIRRHLKQLARSEASINHLNLVLKAVRNVTQLMTRETSRERLIQRTCELLVETRGFHNAWILLLSRDGRPTISAEAGLGQDFMLARQIINKGELVPCCRQLSNHDGVLLIKDPHVDCRGCPLSEMYVGRAGMAVKLEHNEKLYGYMVVSTPREHISGTEEHRLFNELAQDIALSLHHMSVEEDRLMAVRALSKSEEQYRTLAANIPDSDIYLFDSDLRYVVAEGSEIRANNLHKTFYEGKTLYETWDSSLVSVLEPYYKLALQGKAGKTEYHCCNKDYSLSVVPIFDESHKSVGGIALTQNITMRKAAEKDLQNSQSLLQSVFDAIPGLINVLDRDLNIVWSNWHDHDYITQDERESRPLCHRVFLHRERPCDNCHVQTIFETGEPITAEVFNSVEGRYKEVRSFPVLDSSGGVRHVVEYAIDITERKRNEKVQQALINIAEGSYSTAGVNDFLALVHKELGTIIDAANFYIALWDPETEFYSFPYCVDEFDGTDFTPDQLKRSLTDYVRRTGRALLADEDTHRRLQDAGEADLVGEPSKLWMGVPLRTSRGVLGVVVIQNYVDSHAYAQTDLDLLSFITGHITSALERKMAEETVALFNEQLLRANLELESKQSELEEFIYTVSHDLKAPIVSISGFAGLIKEKLTGMVDDGTAKYLERIHVNSAIMDGLITDLLELSRIGRVEESKTSVDFDIIADEVLDSFSVAAREKNIRLIKIGKLPKISGWRKRIRQMLSNLIDNAIKYMPHKKGAVIEIGYEPSDDDSMGVFYVRDNGQGIAPEFHERIFGMFQRAPLPGTQIEGNGIGLTIVKRIVEKHGGKIWVESVPGQGATFYFTLPLCANERDETSTAATQKNRIIM